MIPAWGVRAPGVSVAAEAPWQLDVEGVEVDVADLLEELGGPGAERASKAGDVEGVEVDVEPDLLAVRIEPGPEPEGPPVRFLDGVVRRQGSRVPRGQSSRLPAMTIASSPPVMASNHDR